MDEFDKVKQAVKGTIVQVKPDAGTIFDGCLIVVEEPKDWGFQGYAIIPNQELKNRDVISIAPCRLSWPLVEPVGTVAYDVG